jgi:hypothetical protein
MNDGMDNPRNRDSGKCLHDFFYFQDASFFSGSPSSFNVCLISPTFAETWCAASSYARRASIVVSARSWHKNSEGWRECERQSTRISLIWLSRSSHSLLSGCATR